jgi:hypothetical protein
MDKNAVRRAVCSLDAKVEIEGKFHPIDFQIADPEAPFTCPPGPAGEGRIRGTVRFESEEEVVIELEAPSGTSPSGAKDLAVALRDLAQQIQTEPSKTAVASAPRVVSTPETKPNVGYVAPLSVAYQGGAIPAGSTIEKRPNIAFVATGVSILGTAYAASLITAIAQCGPGMACSDGAGWLYLPIVGPFVTAAMARTTGGQAIAAFDGGVQTLGGALAITGFIAQKKFVVWQDEKQMASLAVTPNAGGVSLTLTHR